MLLSLQKYDSLDMSPSREDVTQALLDTLVFQASQLTRNSSFSHNLATTICLNVKGMSTKKERTHFFSFFPQLLWLLADSFAKCKVLLENGLQNLIQFESRLKKEEARIRIRRGAACAGASSLDDGLMGQMLDDIDNVKIGQLPLKQTSPKFNLKHVMDDVDFDQPLTLDRKVDLANKWR